MLTRSPPLTQTAPTRALKELERGSDEPDPKATEMVDGKSSQSQTKLVDRPIAVPNRILTQVELLSRQLDNANKDGDKKLEEAQSFLNLSKSVF